MHLKFHCFALLATLMLNILLKCQLYRLLMNKNYYSIVTQDFSYLLGL